MTLHSHLPCHRRRYAGCRETPTLSCLMRRRSGVTALLHCDCQPIRQLWLKPRQLPKQSLTSSRKPVAKRAPSPVQLAGTCSSLAPLALMLADSIWPRGSTYRNIGGCIVPRASYPAVTGGHTCLGRGNEWWNSQFRRALTWNQRAMRLSGRTAKIILVSFLVWCVSGSRLPFVLGRNWALIGALHRRWCLAVTGRGRPEPLMTARMPARQLVFLQQAAELRMVVSSGMRSSSGQQTGAGSWFRTALHHRWIAVAEPVLPKADARAASPSG